MNEKLVTLAIGLGVGVILAGAVLFGPKILGTIKSFPSPIAKSGVKEQSVIADNTAKTNAAPLMKLTFDSPEDNTSVAKSKITVTGTAPAGNTIYLFGPADEETATADAQGKFSSAFTLEEGENEVSVSTVDTNNNILSVKHSITLEVSSQ